MNIIRGLEVVDVGIAGVVVDDAVVDVVEVSGNAVQVKISISISRFSTLLYFKTT